MIRAAWEDGAALVLLVSLVTWVLGATGLVRERMRLSYTALGVAVIGIIPFTGISLAGLVLGFSPSLSVAGTALWASLLIRRLWGIEAFGVNGTERLALIVAAVSVPVAVSSIAGVGPAIYESGYGFTPWDFVLAGSAVFLFLRGSRLSYLLVSCLAAHSLCLMRTSNIFDTLMDGPAMLASLALISRWGISRIRPLPNRFRV